MAKRKRISSVAHAPKTQNTEKREAETEMSPADTFGADGEPIGQAAERPEVECSAGNQKEFALRNAHKNTLLQLGKCYDMLNRLAERRIECKLSGTRVTGVARELKELIKVMSVYS